MRVSRILVAIVAALAVVPAFAQLTLDRPFPDPVAYVVDTGLVDNATLAPSVVHEEVVRIDGAAWLRIYFGDDINLGQGSVLRITSDLDGEVQELDAEALEMWSNTSAYFNGDTVRVELIAGPQSVDNRLTIDEVAWEAAPAVPTGDCGICGPDDRVSSDEDFAARLVPAGCSATIYNSQSCAVSAGHCVSGGMVLQFKVPLSNPNCSVNHPPVSEQFPVAQFNFTNGGVGNDWSVLVMGTNGLGEKPFDRYGASKPIATTPPNGGDDLTIWGYGVDSQCIFTATQQTSDGAVTGVSGLFFNHNVDATFGNSGSSVMRNGDEILGIATHCPCPNWATRIDHPNFAAARDNLCPTSAPQVANLISANVLVGTPVSGAVSDLTLSDNSHFIVDSIEAGVRNNTLTEVVAQSPLSAASQLSLRVEFGPADASPVFYLIQLLDSDSGTWNTLQFGITSSTADTVVNIASVSNPNAAIDGSGQIRVRVGQTARLTQTPGGFTKLVDQVLVTVTE